MKKKIPDALRLKLSKAGKKGWRAKIKKYQVGQANAKIENLFTDIDELTEKRKHYRKKLSKVADTTELVNK